MIKKKLSRISPLIKGLLITIFIFSIICMCACNNNREFSGSKTGNDIQFLIDFEFMNTTVSSKMRLLKDEAIKTDIDIIKGYADIIIKNENGKIAYRGNNVTSGNFTIYIEENGDYTISVTGNKAIGHIYFTKILAENAK